mmetsp:Transcript_18570/g.48897  ORF Transcript_18570/g.48897 Transcript_18570/m.48897 type:complete len:127 (-) Transcript_18570:171-551(-)
MGCAPECRDREEDNGEELVAALKMPRASITWLWRDPSLYTDTAENVTGIEEIRRRAKETIRYNDARIPETYPAGLDIVGMIVHRDRHACALALINSDLMPSHSLSRVKRLTEQQAETLVRFIPSPT